MENQSTVEECLEDAVTTRSHPKEMQQTHRLLVATTTFILMQKKDGGEGKVTSLEFIASTDHAKAL